jgi:hypothetical protein
MIRIEFPGYGQSRDESLQEITWDEFFDQFEKNNLALTYQETTAGGQQSNFNKLIARERAGAGNRGRKRSGRSASTGRDRSRAQPGRPSSGRPGSTRSRRA